jgi:predicted O-methyltransferase YrrM
MNPLSWRRKLLSYDLSCLFSPDADSALCDALRIMARDRRRAPAKHRHALGVFFQYVGAANLMANLAPLSVVLELGRGYSTLALACALPPDCAIVSVDGKPVDAYDIAPSLRAIAPRVRFVDGFTVTAPQMRAFYDGADKDAFLGAAAEDLARTLPGFLAPAATPYAAALALPPEGPDFAARCLELLLPGGKVRCLSRLFPDLLAAELRYPPQAGPTALDRALAEHPQFDAVFFDCGEFSSPLEWELLRGRIRPGGLALFHDIYFPKSVKNFQVAAAIAASPDWEILHQDRSTPQGLLAARRRE